VQTTDTVHGEIKYVALLFQIVANIFSDIGVIFDDQYAERVLLIQNTQGDIL
jgi:hypothetical protein